MQYFLWDENHEVLIIRVVFPAKRELMLIERNVSIPAICLVVSRLPAGKRRVRDVLAICVFWRVSSSSEPDVSTPETRERRNQLSLVLASLNTRRDLELCPERIVTNANSISYAFFFRFTPRREREDARPVQGEDY